LNVKIAIRAADHNNNKFY